MKFLFYSLLAFNLIIPFESLKCQSVDSKLSLSMAIDSGLSNYDLIKSKRNIEKSNLEGYSLRKSENLPDLSISLQNSFGTINSSIGPSYSFKGLTASSSGPLRNNQSWDAAFGSLYLANFQWDFFAFGKARQKAKIAYYTYLSSKADLEQEEFELKIKISGSYLNLLAAKSLENLQVNNLTRAKQVLKVVLSRTKSGLNPGVDSSIALAEVSNAQSTLISANQKVKDLETEICIEMGIKPRAFLLDTLFNTIIPPSLDSINPAKENHPILNYFRSLVQIENQNLSYLNKGSLPVFTLFDVFQTRGSGFNNSYSDNAPNDYSQNFLSGIKPTRSNYLIGIGVFWNFSDILRTGHKISQEKFLINASQNQYDFVNSQLKAEQDLAQTRILNALKQNKEVPIQLQAASTAYLQKSMLYKNGLSTLVDLSQTLFNLNQAENLNIISHNNVWTALLLKSAAIGDFNLFLNQIPTK